MIEQRKKLGLSQLEVANYLGISRPTLASIEKGERAIKPSEQKKLNELFDSLKNPELNPRDNIPKGDTKKFKQVLLYILEKVGAKPNIGQTVLYKLLYFMDFDYYEKYEEQFMGLTYFKNTYGPVPREFKKVIDQMIADEEIEALSSKHFKYRQKKYLPLKPADTSVLTIREKDMIDSVLFRYGDKSATEISELSHLDAPWRVAEDMADLEYEHAFYRPDRFSVRDYGEL